MSHLYCRKLYSQINVVTDSSGYITENVKICITTLQQNSNKNEWFYYSLVIFK